MACDPQLFTGVDQAKFASVKDVLQSEYGLTVDAHNGQQSHRGFTFEWAYDADEERLRIQCLSKPLLIPCGVVNGRISALAAKSGVSPA